MSYSMVGGKKKKKKKKRVGDKSMISEEDLADYGSTTPISKGSGTSAAPDSDNKAK